MTLVPTLGQMNLASSPPNSPTPRTVSPGCGGNATLVRSGLPSPSSPPRTSSPRPRHQQQQLRGPQPLTMSIERSLYSPRRSSITRPRAAAEDSIGRVGGGGSGVNLRPRPGSLYAPRGSSIETPRGRPPYKPRSSSTSLLVTPIIQTTPTPTTMTMTTAAATGTPPTSPRGLHPNAQASAISITSARTSTTNADDTGHTGGAGSGDATGGAGAGRVVGSKGKNRRWWPFGRRSTGTAATASSTTVNSTASATPHDMIEPEHLSTSEPSTAIEMESGSDGMPLSPTGTSSSGAIRPFSVGHGMSRYSGPESAASEMDDDVAPRWEEDRHHDRDHSRDIFDLEHAGIPDVLGPDEVELSDWSDEEEGSVSSHVNVYGAGGFVQSTDYAPLSLVSPKALLHPHREFDVDELTADDGETPSAGVIGGVNVQPPFWAINPPSPARAVSPVDRGRRSIGSRSPTRSSHIGSYTPGNPLEDYAAARTRRSVSPFFRCLPAMC